MEEVQVQPPVTPSIDSNGKGGEMDVTEASFMDLCEKELSIEENKCTEALTLFKETKQILSANTSSIGSGAVEEAERFWFAFILYSVKRLSERKEGELQGVSGDNGFNLCQILRVLKLNIVDFFKELPQFVVKAGPILRELYGTDWENRLQAKELQANFVHLSLLSKYYKRAYREFFLTNDSNAEKDSCGETTASYMSDYFRFGWLLFLALRVHAFSRFKDLVTCTNGLVAILAILIMHVPHQFRNFSLQDSRRFVKRDGRGIDLLASLCNIYDTSEDELKITMEKANNLIEKILKKKPSLASESQTDKLENIDPDGLVYFEDLLDETSISSSLSMLEKDYDDAIRNKGELDERMFINEEDSLLGSGSLSGGAVNITGVKRKIDLLASPARTVTSPLSPHRSPSTSKTNGVNNNNKTIATPVSTAMTTAKWLRTVICPLPSKPSPELEHFLKSCDRDITNDVTRRAHIILEAIFPNSSLGDRYASGSLQSVNLMDDIWAEQRRAEALKLYYRILEAMCKAEAQLLHASNLTSLLTNERFHRCMLACSAELVLATHKTITMLFPAVLERTGITAFDLSKVIESFIRHEDSLPRELRRHLNSLEERLLESMVWEKGSSMYNSLIVARSSLSSEINHLGLLAEPMPSLDAIAALINFSGGSYPASSVPKHEPCLGQNLDIRSPKRLCGDYRSVLVERNSFTSPVKDRLLTLGNLKSKMLPPPLQSAFASPTRPNPGGGGETCAETGINIFFTKINKLAAVRINGMVERLQLSQQMRESVYCLFQRVLGQRTSLFFNRHIDQIILCCFYGMAKISQMSLTFREIIYNYRKQPQCKPQVFRSVFVDSLQGRRPGVSTVSQRVGPDHVDIITFYNEVFIPTVKPLLVELGPVRTPTKDNRMAEATNKLEGPCPCPGSPKVSAFPNVPDMSPKKVSATHNVYVSPLRTSKMDALISHSSKSYYACVGESTHAFQSPSKDLSAINSRLNNNNKPKRSLTFEVDAGLVSDSMVATTLLHVRNGTTSSSSCLPLPKTEHPDS
ncbi:PREDICTED: retinoblastoma-related protein 1-like isoform X2 [Tarenaya hassleriana]|uniref:retinoblastoma-related protein 1-like isoform X2 n=1 Tax=Tarenaya hassleriana TaxID=28532 RepID=UPI00053C2A44|nr:PREDICTED: retinoblastoma-related protein 1-like isoform X2 [Tarenaya hassleriana]